MARDEESTQPIDVEELRRGLPESTAAPEPPPTSLDLDATAGPKDFTDEHTAIDGVSYAPSEPPPIGPRTEPPPSYQPETSSITRSERSARLDAAPPSYAPAYMPETSSITQDRPAPLFADAYAPGTSSITRFVDRPDPTSAPLPSFELPSDDDEDDDDDLGATTGEARPPVAEEDPSFGITAHGSASVPLGARETTTPADLLVHVTQHGEVLVDLPNVVAAEEPLAAPTPSEPLPSFEAPTSRMELLEETPPERTLSVSPVELARLAAAEARERDASAITAAPVSLEPPALVVPERDDLLPGTETKLAVMGLPQLGGASPAPVHPADELDDTRLGRMNVAEVRAAFAAAEAADAGNATPAASIEAVLDDVHEEMDSAELESDADLGAHFDEAAESGELLDLSASDPAIEILTGAVPAAREGSSVSVPVSVAPASPSRVAPTKPRAGGYVPPAPAGAAPEPAYLAFGDEDERQLASEGAWDALLELYRLRLADAETPSTKALLFHKIAAVHEHGLGRTDEAFALLLQAIDERPMDDAVVTSLERLALANGRLQELAEHARAEMKKADHESRVAWLGHLVYWYERRLARGKDASPFAAELERIDKTHPVSLRRAAQIAAVSGDVKTQRELLLRALDRVARPDEKATLNLQIASTWAGSPEATRYYEAALSHDPDNIIGLQALERLGREQEKFPQVEWALERQAEVAETESERVRALLELAQLNERRFLRREVAAEMFERVLQLEPAQPTALEGLERCYHALRAWPELARVLRLRADQTFDKAVRAQLLERAAEAYESKLSDLPAAIEVHLALLEANPKHKRAVTDLARLYEKLGDWSAVATYKARLAELAPTPKQSSVMFAQLGDMLAAPDKDPVQARLAYERAVSADAGNLAAWEALQRLAEQAGDLRRAAQCLEKRAEHAPGPRQRALALVELGTVERSSGNERAARAAFEAAIQADPTNETAAREVLEHWIREERWPSAAPVCELLVNAAVRDRDAENHFKLVRLATRIHAALGDADRAMASAILALETRPEDAAAQADLVAVTSQCRDRKALVAKARPWLVRISETSGELPVDILQRLGELHRDERELEAAAAMFERARRRAPDDPALQKQLAEVYLGLGDFPRACKLKVDLARNATSEDVKFRELVEAGEIWAKQARELPQAASVFEEARKLRPTDSWLLHTLMATYTSLEAWDDLAGVLESITRIQDTTDKRVKSLYAMAQVVREKVRDSLRCAELLEEILDLDRKRLDVFEELVRTRTEVKDWDGLERSYRKMIARVKDDGNGALSFALFHQLGLIYRDRIGDAERAYEALDAAAHIDPTDPEVRKIVTELLVVTDNLDNAVLRTRQAIERDPHDPELYAELYELFLRQHLYDRAWCAVNVLASLRELTEEQRTFLEDYPPANLAQVPGQIVEQAWQTHVFHADLDRTLTSPFAFMTPAVARMRHAQLRPDQMLSAVGRPFSQAHSSLYESVRATFANGAEILGMRPPDLLLGDLNGSVPFTPALAPFGALHVSPAALEARADGLLYLVGKRLAEQRPELTARAFFPSVPDLSSLLTAAVRVSRQERANDPASAQLDASLLSVMTTEEREGIRSIVVRAQMEGSRVDVKRWSQAADLSSMRAGLLLSGDVSAARRIVLGEPQSAADLPPREKLAELYKFATSDLYADLRGAIGVAVPNEDEGSAG